MSTPALYTFTAKDAPELKEINFVYHSDGYPSGAADIIRDLAVVASRMWSGENVDLAELTLPHIDSVELRESRAQSAAIRPVPFRYEIEVVDGRPVAVRALRHEPVISEEIVSRVESARSALEEAERAMQAAANVPTYTELLKGPLPSIKALGLGHSENE